jgi:hypothetical protein
LVNLDFGGAKNLFDNFDQEEKRIRKEEILIEELEGMDVESCNGIGY